MSYSLNPENSHSSGKDDNQQSIRDVIEENNPNSAMNGTLTQSQLTSFNAYPLEYSSNFLKPDNQVLFIPLTPTDLPLTLPESDGCLRQSQPMHPQIHHQPLCHGFFFPQSTSHAGMGYPVHEAEDVDAHSGLLIPPSNTAENHAFDQDTTGQLQLLLLQQLIHLQLEKQALNRDKQSTHSNVTYQPYSPPQDVPPAYPPTSSMSYPTNFPNHTDMCTYIIPVEAQIHEDKGIALHVTPRAENFGSDTLNRNPSVTMGCPSEQLVLYPYTSQKNITECFNSDSEDAFYERNSMAPAQTFTMDDLHQCIRRGSFERTSETSNDIVNSMKGCTKSGFVLLSIRHERINQDERPSLPSNTISNSVDTQPVSGPQVDAHTETKGNSTENRSPKRLVKKKYKSQKSDADHRRRVSRKSIRTPLKEMQENGIQTVSAVDPNEDENKAATSVSRFRVTRFADKHQAWLAPAHSGCFVVHDLWTTKLPDYVLKSIEQFEAQKSLVKECAITYETPPLTVCAVCQSNQPKACNCGGDMRIRMPD